MAKKLQLRGGTTSEHSSFTGAVREVTVDTDKDVVVVHDGSTAGGFPSVKSGSIVNADIDASAAIAQSKLVDIVNADVGASAAIATSKLSGAVTSIASHGLSTSNWDTAYTDRNKWDGGATGLTAATGRTSLGLGTSAIVDTGTSANQILKLDGTAKIPAVDGSQLTNLPASGMPSGTIVAFFQASAPTGWTQNTTHNDKMLRVVSGTGGGTAELTGHDSAGRVGVQYSF